MFDGDDARMYAPRLSVFEVAQSHSPFHPGGARACKRTINQLPKPQSHTAYGVYPISLVIDAYLESCLHQCGERRLVTSVQQKRCSD